MAARAFSPAVTSSIAPLPDPPTTHSPTPSVAAITTKARTATAARRCDSRRVAAGVTRR